MTLRQLLKSAKADYENDLSDSDPYRAIYAQEAPEQLGIEAVNALRKANPTTLSLMQLHKADVLEVFNRARNNCR